MNVLTVVTRGFSFFGDGRSPAVLLNLGVPRRGYRVQRNIVYGPHPRQQMDLYRPAESNLGDGGSPVIVFFYGGAFRSGRRSEYRFVGEALATAGMTVAIPDYRIYPRARFPDFLHDGAMAVAKVRELDAAPTGLFLMGHSAGAYIAAMLGANESYLRACGGDHSWIRGVIALSGRYHDSPLQDSTAQLIFGGPARDETRPASFLHSRCPPMFLAVGARENPIVLASKRALVAELRRRSNEAEEATYTGIGHVGIIAALAPPYRRRAPVRADILRFIERYVRRPNGMTELRP